jgi:hypothetical protein
MSLWDSASPFEWAASLARYDEVVSRQGVAALAALDHWHAHALPTRIRERTPPCVVHDELVRLTEWKMARGVWRAPNLILVKGNAPEKVEAISTQAFAQAPHPTAPIAMLATLAGVGPATASAAAAAFLPTVYPFFDELVAAQIPGLGKVAWTMSYYGRYANALRARATTLGADWTPVMIERALWAFVGGKAKIRS